MATPVMQVNQSLATVTCPQSRCVALKDPGSTRE